MNMRYHHHVSEYTMLTAARALLKFCRDHQYPAGGLVDLEACVTALESGEFRATVTSFRRIPFGGNGCFNNWCPPVVYEHEDRVYVSAVFDALCERFHRLFRTAAGDA